MRVLFNDGQEITFQDLNRIMQGTERWLLERLMHHMVGETTQGFFDDSFFVDFTDATHVSIRAGLGVQNDNTQTSPESKRRLLWRDAAVALTLDAPDPTNPRIDIVVVKADRTNVLTESRQIKDFLTSVVAPQSIVTETDWLATCQVVAGTPAGSPSEPATPAGYIKIATMTIAAVSGLANQAAITDNRVKMPILDLTAIDTSGFAYVPTQAIGTPLKTVLAELDALASAASAVAGIYDAIVGSASWCTHSTLASALTAASAGWRILVIENQSLNAAVNVNALNIEIHLKPGVVVSKGSATTGFNVQAGGGGFNLHGGKMSGFNGVGDKAVAVNASATSCSVWGMRFQNNDTNVDDSAVDVMQFGNIQE